MAILALCFMQWIALVKKSPYDYKWYLWYCENLQPSCQSLSQGNAMLKNVCRIGPEYDLLLIHSFWFYLPLEYIKVIMVLGSSRNTGQPAAYGHLSNQGFSVLNLIQALAGCLTLLAQSIEEGKIEHWCDCEGGSLKIQLSASCSQTGK